MSTSNEASLQKGRTLLGLQILSDFGDQITAALLALCILDISKSTNEVGFVYFIGTIGFILFTILGGYLGDRISKRNILCYSDAGRGLVVLLMIVALQIKSIALIYAASFFLSLLGSLHRPVKFSLWTNYIPRDRLELYNCFSELSTHSSVIVGPLIASLLLINGFTNWGFTLDALTFFACAIAFSFIITERPIDITVKKKNDDLFLGFKLILRDRELHKYISYDAVQMLAHGAFNATFLVLAQRDFGWSKTDYSWHLSITAGFAILGASIATLKFVSSLNAITRLTTCTLISAISLGMLLYNRTFPLGSLLYGICTSMAIIAMVVTKTKAQMHGNSVYPESLSSILAARAIFIKTAALLGAGGCLVVSNFFSLKTTLWIFLVPLALGFLPFITEFQKRREVQTTN
jgi:MFS family permease